MSNDAEKIPQATPSSGIEKNQKDLFRINNNGRITLVKDRCKDF